jgi:hypothetical protein
MEALVAIAGFLLEHADLITLVMNAIKGGANKDNIVKAIQAEMLAASDAEMKRELG